ncbi:MAG: hypothetical protein COB32_07640 [Halomonas sp.]|jgi:serine/threonine-protein kinase HipA|nr:HipA N-terminal domain-containing protein [Halomonas sp.]PHR02611.1 MAG: hypothetical protein COB32_07640 [Halomonas sp.]|tara:strand:- start:149 stop:745 length:597 start_codon:yes stop_codon:yes gene_type:complete
MTPDQLIVWQNHQRVGTLWRGLDGRLMGFEYDEEWQASGQAISNSLPLNQRTWPPETLTAHHWFGNLLPEEQARAALIRQLGIPDDDFSLLAAIGGDCAGALSILPPHQTPEPSNRHDCDTPLSQERLNEWAAFKQRYALFAESQQAPKPRLSGIAPLSGSLISSSHNCVSHSTTKSTPPFNRCVKPAAATWSSSLIT